MSNWILKDLVGYGIRTVIMRENFVIFCKCVYCGIVNNCFCMTVRFGALNQISFC